MTGGPEATFDEGVGVARAPSNADASDGSAGKGSVSQEPAGVTEATAEELSSERAILTDAAGLAAERDEYLGALQRLQADFENYRKRVLRQQQEQSARAALDLVGKMLPVLDTLDLARAHLGGGNAGAEASEEARALDQARSQLLDVLAKEGLERVDAVEVEFDPVVHDAVATSAGASEPPSPSSEPAGSAGRSESGGPSGPPETTNPPGAADATGAVDNAHTAGVAHAADAADAAGNMKVEEVLRAGYRWRGQVLRPAMVRVRG